MFRLVTYNVHKCRGMDRRVNPTRIADVLREVDADVIALQEVLGVHKSRREDVVERKDQLRFIAAALNCEFSLGENRRIGGVAYGNATLSRLPLRYARNYDLTWRDREKRGCLRTDITAGGATLHIFNVHLGTAFLERRYQARKLVSREVLADDDLRGPRVVVGDFNEWTRGLASQLLSERFESVDVRTHLGKWSRTYPGIFPVLHLDHVYYDRSLRLINFRLHRSRTAMLASDHLPMVADFSFV